MIQTDKYKIILEKLDSIERILTTRKEEKTIKVSKAAELLGVTTITVYRYIKSGLFKPVMKGKTAFLFEKDVINFEPLKRKTRQKKT
jgi:DeoR/GlpR family transcriptional regulator of sugar metabolism